MTSFRADILDSSLMKNPKNELHDLCDQYTSVLTSLLDKHAPLQTKKVAEKAPTPWMTSKLLNIVKDHVVSWKGVGGDHALVMTDQNTATIEIYAIVLWQRPNLNIFQIS